MKLFTKAIDEQLFKQYPLGSDLSTQMVVAKIFNPYGRGTWYLLNSDPQDSDYIWAIVDLFDVEMGSVSRSELEGLKVPPFRLGLERDTFFTPINALTLYQGLMQGKMYEDGGETKEDFLEDVKEMHESIAEITLKDGSKVSGEELMMYGHPKVIRTQFEDEEFEFADGGEIKWQDVYEGDSANVKAENKTGVIVKTYGRKFHLKFVDGSEKTYDASELEFFKSEDEFADGGGIGFIPMDLEEKLAITARWGGTNIKGVIGFLNAMIDSDLTDEDLKPNPTKNTRFQIERAEEKKIQEIWKKIKPKYTGGLEGNWYYSTIKRLVQRSRTDDNILKQFKPFRKYQKFADGGEMMENGGEIVFYQDFRPKERKFKIGELVFFEADRIKNVEAKVLAKVDEKRVKIEILESYTPSKNVRISGDEKADISLMTKVGLGKESLAFEKGKEVKIGTIKVVNQEKINPLKGYTPLNYIPKSKEFSDVMKMADGGETEVPYLTSLKSKLEHAKKYNTKKVPYYEEKIKEWTSKKENKPKMAMGGETTFEEKVKAVKSSLLKRKKVSPKVQKDYGKTYSPKEAEESAKRIVGSRVAKWNEKIGKK